MSPRRIALGVLSFTVWLGAVAVACTTGTTPDCSLPNSACGPGFDGPPPDGSLVDAVSEQVSDGSPDATRDGSVEASDALSEGADDSPPADAAPTPCHHLKGKGTGLVCDYTDDTPACVGMQKAGSCPKKNLTGCCVTTTGSGTTAICYYIVDVPDAAIEQGLCADAGSTWTTTAP